MPTIYRRRRVSIPSVMPTGGFAISYDQGSTYTSPRPLPGGYPPPWTPAPTALYSGNIGGWPILTPLSRTPGMVPVVTPISPFNTPPLWPPPPPTVFYTPFLNAPVLPPVWEPGTFPPQPFGSEVPLRIHPHLIYNPVDQMIPVLQWDIVHPAEQTRVLTGRQILIPTDLDAEAVTPNVGKIWIFSDVPDLATWMQVWGPVKIKKPRITVRDVLDAIYDYFQTPLTRQDVRLVKQTPGNENNLTLAAHQRAGDSYELQAVSLRSGFRRVDVMGSRRRFQGLRAMVYPDKSYKLFLGLLHGPGPRFS